MNAENLPEEIIFDILSRLPVVSLCRFRCVSKSWHSLISSPHFITTHLNRSNNNKYERLILSDSLDFFYSVELQSSQFRPQSVAVRLNFPPDQNPGYVVMDIGNSCDGLVLMLDDRYHCCLLNPSTRESRELPLPPFTIDPYFTDYDPYFTDYGLGYDSSIDDYKVVTIYYDREAKKAGGAINVVSVYSLKTDSWRTIENYPYDHSCFDPHSGAFVCGALHWVGRNGTDDVITALGLTDEIFWTLPSPTPDCIFYKLFVLGGCLGVCDNATDGVCVKVWVMKEYGVGDSWTKFTVTYGNSYAYWIPLGLATTGQVLFNRGGEKLVLFDPREKESKELVVHGCPAYFQAGIYVESLVSPKRLC